MTSAASIAPPAATGTSLSERRRVVVATTVGTAIEWYDYFLYAATAGLVFRQMMFAGLGPNASSLVAYLSVGLSFLFRPLGAFLAGHLGDRYGRRFVLLITLFGMGSATTLIGVLPTYQTIGVWSPILLFALRIIQGISAGGEWGGAVLMAVEHAPAHQRGLFGAGPQMGVPAGLLLSSAALTIMSVIAPGDAFLQWGWRVPFLASFLLVVVAYIIRVGVDESPVFAEIQQRAEQEEKKSPIVTLFRFFLPTVVVAALVFAGNGTVGYMTTGGYIQKYATDPDGPIGLSRQEVLSAVTVSAVVWMVATAAAGWASDKMGRRATYILGFLLQGLGVVALFPLVNTGSVHMLGLALACLAIGLGFTYGQQSAMYTELFPASIRATGVSVTYAIGSILGGAFAPMIADWLFQTTGTTVSITTYLLVMTLVGLLCVLLLRDRTRIPLGPDHEHEQRRSPLRIGGRRSQEDADASPGSYTVAPSSTPAATPES
ncbi:MFS transporter [Corynebacterium uberis]|uniref:MFS transporter n=1 Tax=Corynebacterium TaxID=1716 RepID=UPI001D09C814|nr:MULTISPECIES: MFS transporter [Corynebacterium]MCZ9310050.1 MHS family MFS transporter [Corynebacterium sp. c6VSa_13]UDL73798.1 MHS family MFS transporter [Corynebacterium uberis]UDL75319.1 MHS family MFS transporter [Corynebacterium uberis]UDL77530.1 MHS family MFS transporter [Corynebacterium uberis]UDL79817.1 MHS family MFS transporter [Corynebacterium uberis]